MNMQFRREVLPAVYQLPMHVPVLPHWVIDRYGDIWGGFILKTLMDIRGDTMVVGEPMIHHLKEGNFRRNIWQEHVCHLVNDEFIALLGEGATRIPPQHGALLPAPETLYGASDARARRLGPPPAA
jgi:hypothetical protein